jgi:hypothetical protein
VQLLPKIGVKKAMTKFSTPENRGKKGRNDIKTSIPKIGVKKAN